VGAEGEKSRRKRERKRAGNTLSSHLEITLEAKRRGLLSGGLRRGPRRDEENKRPRASCALEEPRREEETSFNPLDRRQEISKGKALVEESLQSEKKETRVRVKIGVSSARGEGCLSISFSGRISLERKSLSQLYRRKSSKQYGSWREEKGPPYFCCLGEESRSENIPKLTIRSSLALAAWERDNSLSAL